MLKVKLKQELADLQKDSVKKSEEFVQEIKLLMDSNSDKEKQVLKELGLGANIVKAEKAIAKAVVFKELDEKYEGQIYTEEQIKALAIKYRLRFLNTTSFEGHIAPEVGSVLVRFCEKNLINSSYERDRFYILAPVNSFKLEKKPVDPLLFYKIESRNHDERMYKLVYKWGEDFTIARRGLGFLYSDKFTLGFSRWLTMMFTLLIASSAAKGIAWLFVNEASGQQYLYSVISWVAFGIFCLINGIMILQRDADLVEDHELTKNNWNSKFSN